VCVCQTGASRSLGASRGRGGLKVAQIVLSLPANTAKAQKPHHHSIPPHSTLLQVFCHSSSFCSSQTIIVAGTVVNWSEFS
jgi:hypothetical protein